MATLKDLFEENSKDIYKRFSPSRDQLIVVKPDTNGVFGSNSRIKNDTRSIPTVSVLRDTRRVSKFLTSSEGVLFLAKQALLQTGNTFSNSRLYNPASPLLNTVPFLHTRRHLSVDVITPNAYGLLQNTTVNTVASNFTISGLIQTALNERGSLLPSANSIAKTYLGRQLKNAIYKIVPLPQNYLDSRPEYKVFSTVGPVVFDPQPLDQRGLPKLNLKANLKNLVISKTRDTLKKVGLNTLNKILPKSLKNTPIVATIQNELNPEEDKIPSFVDAAKKFRQTFYDNRRKFKRDAGTNRLKNRYFNETEASDDNFDPLQRGFGVKKSKTSLQDPYNIAPFAPTFDLNKINYRNIVKEQDENTDIIKFIFSDIEGQNPVYFRALLSSIKESIKPEFTEQRYVGRTERFVTYSGAKRGVNITFNIVAFSEKERDGMWTKVNYLTGLAFPKGVENGFMVPPLFKITVGGIYDRQPCYIESLDYDLLDESITFDIDKEVPFAINVTMQLSILEKRSKFHDSPFYKIIEDTNEAVLQRLASAPTTTRLGAFNPGAVVALPNSISARQ